MAVAARAQDDRQAGLRILAELAIAARLVEELERLLEGQLVRRHVVRDAGGALAVLEVGPVLAHLHDDGLAVLVADGHRLEATDLVEVDLTAELALHQLVEALVVALAEEEALEVGAAPGLAAGDLVEIVLHAGGEVVVHQVVEVALEEPGHLERLEGRDQRGALLPDVAALLDHADDGGVGRGTADAALLEPLHQRRLGEARWRLGLVALRLEAERGELLALLQRREVGLAVRQLGGRVVAALDVRLEEAGEGDRVAAGREHGVLAVFALAADADGERLAASVFHLGGDGPLPDQLVDLRLVRADLAGDLVGRAPLVARRADGLVSLLGVLYLALVDARLRGQVGLVVEVEDLLARGLDRRVGQGRAVRTHVGDVAVLVEPLRAAHGALRAEAELSARLLLERRGHEGRGRTAAVVLLFEVLDGEGPTLEGLRERVGRLFVQVRDVALHLAAVVEVATGGDALPVDLQERRGDAGLLGVLEEALEVPVRRLHEGDALALALDHCSGGDRLDSAGGAATATLTDDLGHREAVEAVEDSAGLLGVDQALVDVSGIRDGFLDRLGGDLVEHHPADRDLRLEHLDQVPRDALSLAVLIGREQELVGLLELLAELGDVRLAVARDQIEGLEVLLDVDRVLLDVVVPALDLLFEVGGTSEVTDVADRRFDHIALPQILLDGGGFCGGLDDDERAGHGDALSGFWWALSNGTSNGPENRAAPPRERDGASSTPRRNVPESERGRLVGGRRVVVDAHRFVGEALLFVGLGARRAGHGLLGDLEAGAAGIVELLPLAADTETVGLGAARVLRRAGLDGHADGAGAGRLDDVTELAAVHFVVFSGFWWARTPDPLR